MPFSYPLEFKASVIEQAKPLILNSSLTLVEIAEHLGVGDSTLRLWLAALGDDYLHLRQAWIDRKLVDAESALLQDHHDMLALARAREQWKCATWWASMRDPRYREKQDVTIDKQVTVHVYRNEAQDVVSDESVVIPELPPPQ